MKRQKNARVRFGLTAGLLCLCPIFALLLCSSSVPALAQDAQPGAEKAGASESTTNKTSTSAAKPDAATNTVSTEAGADLPPLPPTAASGAKTNLANQVKSDVETGSTNDIQVSFQGANVDMIVQWLAQTTGKSVVKHPRVQCQITIVSSKKVSPREAINLIYRALAMEGFTAVESSNLIQIVPEGQEPKMTPVLIEASQSKIPEGRQKILKYFPLAHISAGELKEKIRGVLSDKGTIDTDDRANQVIVADYNENVQLAAELIKELDVSSAGSTIEFYPIKHADAEELANLLSLILNAQSSGPSSPARPPRSSSSSSSSGGGPPSMSMGGSSPPSGGDSPSPASSAAGGQAAGPQVRIWPDKTGNRLIVAAARSKLPEVKRLVDILDTVKPQDVSVRVIALKNVSAVDLVREISPLYQKVNSKTPRDAVEVSANDRSNSLIIFSSEANFNVIAKMVASLDTEDALEKVTKTFPLKNADAQDVAKQLQDLNGDQSSSSRYTYYFNAPAPRNSKKMTVVADRRRNALIIQAPPAQMDNIDKMIKELDEAVSDDSLAPKIYPLKYASAVDIEAVLNELFLKKTQQRSYWDYYDDYFSGGSSSTPDRDVGRLYGKVRITSEPYSNAIIITSNSKENLTAVLDVLKQLDAPSEAGESTLRVGLKFAKASIVARSLNILFAKNGAPPLRTVSQPAQGGGNTSTPQQQQQQNTSSQSGFDLGQETKEEGYYPWLGGQPDNARTASGQTATRPVSDLIDRVRTVADDRRNSLLISANVHFFPQILKLIDDLDGPTAAVLIEVRVVEVSSDYLDKLGVRWSPDGTKVFTQDDYDNSLLAHANGQYLHGFGPLTTVNTPSASALPSSSLPAALASLRSGVLSSTINMDYLVQFLRKTTAATVLGEPQIMINDNETAKLFVGQRVPIVTGQVNPSTGGSSQNFVYDNVGVILEVTPHINDKGDVQLKIHAESSSIDLSQTISGQPVFDTRAFLTDLTSKNGETLVLGGIIQKQISDTLRKTPILGSIPGVGWAFKKKDKTTHEVELMVFLRPKVVRTPEDAKALASEVDAKAPLLKKWKEDVESSRQKAGNGSAKP